MKIFAKLYHFLGGIYFAIILIGLVAFFVISGTLIESSTESHLYASAFTYRNVFFKLLLWLFFVNILFAALRRWPFKTRHIPFLLTHLGLLMILAGVLIKSYYGTQGMLSILEGSSSDNLYLPETFALRLENRQGGSELLEFKRNFYGKMQGEIAKPKLFPELEITLQKWLAHSEERLQFWIKEDRATILGMPSLPVLKHDPKAKSPLLASSIHPLPFDPEIDWIIYAYKTENLNELLANIYRENAKLRISLKDEMLEVPFRDALTTPQEFLGTNIDTSLNIDYSSILGFVRAEVKLKLTDGKQIGNIVIPLTGPSALLNEKSSLSGYGSSPIAVDILISPTLILAQDTHGDDYLFIVTPPGEIFGESYRADNTQSLYVFDHGYRGYGLKISLPFHTMTPSRQLLESALLHRLNQQLKDLLGNASPMPFPIDALRMAAEQAHIDFAEFWFSFLQEWNHSQSWLFPQQRALPESIVAVMETLDSNLLHGQVLHGSFWISRFFELIDAQWNPSQNLLEFLKETQWPLLAQLKNEIPSSSSSFVLLTALTEQLFALGEHLSPPLAKPFSQMNASERAHHFTALFRLQGLDIQQNYLVESFDDKMDALASYRLTKEFRQKAEDVQMPQVPKELFTSVTRKLTPLPSLQKLENHTPLATLSIKKGERKEIIPLSFDPSGSGLKWPIFDGEYLIRFQPLFQPIPYTVRLRDARQINYPNTLQAYSYESDLIFTEKKPKNLPVQAVETTISMNKVHETPDGYRFYMSNLFPPVETSAQRAQIAVNYDPAKYILTYPGAMILTTGILLLFWLRPRNSKNKT